MRLTKLSFIYVVFTLASFQWVQDSVAQVAEGSIPAPSNINPNDCPCIFEDLTVLFKVNAPNAGKMQIDIAGKMYDMHKNQQGIWEVRTDPLDPGFHYYSLVIEGLKVADPASETFYGMGRMASAIEIHEASIDFYDLKDIPHGELRSVNYFSKTTGSWRKINIYTPPGYDQDQSVHYPVLYIQHGGGEDERGWAEQGKTSIILDNLIAEGKAKPMIVAIPNGNVTKPGMNALGYTDEAMNAFKEELFENIVPFVERNYRAKPNQENRALAGLSMGGGQAFYTGLRNRDQFDYVGIFSTGLFGGIREAEPDFDPETIIPGILSESQTFNAGLKVFYISVGEQDMRIAATKKLIDTFQTKGVKVEFASFPGDHEWQVWRKSLHDFAQRIFKD